jgi:F-type H+-transporting ATPase subunit gamma
MTRLSEIQSHIASMDELRDIVGAMRSLAGMRVQEARQALPAIHRYADSMATGIGSALLLMPQPLIDARQEQGRRALIVCTAEHGFVGGFNERMLEAADAALEASDRLFVLGSRGAALAFERGRKVVWTRSMATRVAGAPDAVNRLTSELYARLARGEIARVAVMFGRYRQGGASTIERRPLLPLDTATIVAKSAHQPPLHNLPSRPLLEKLMYEYVFALLTEATVESIASENAARFAAMESAYDNVSKKLAGLQENARHARQTEITSELLDLITGTEAMHVGSRRVISESRALLRLACRLECSPRPICLRRAARMPFD